MRPKLRCDPRAIDLKNKADSEYWSANADFGDARREEGRKKEAMEAANKAVDDARTAYGEQAGIMFIKKRELKRKLEQAQASRERWAAKDLKYWENRKYLEKKRSETQEAAASAKKAALGNDCKPNYFCAKAAGVEYRCARKIYFEVPAHAPVWAWGQGGYLLVHIPKDTPGGTVLRGPNVEVKYNDRPASPPQRNRRAKWGDGKNEITWK